jgi:hypothetical protein
LNNRPTLPTSPPAPTGLDDRIQALTGYTGRQLQRHYADGLLPADLAALAEAHQALAGEEARVAYHLRRLHQLSDGQRRADAALLERLARAARHLTEAVVQRNGSMAEATAVLERLERAAARPRGEGDLPDLSAPDFAHLLALVRGAKLQQNLVSQRLSVVTASGTRLPVAALRRLESVGLVDIDRAHPLHAGQPVALTALGRRTLTGRPPATAGRR